MGARDTRMVVEFPKKMEEMKVREEQLDKREEKIRQREKSLALQARVMKAKIQAFNTGVAKTIKKSINNAPTKADSWNQKSKVRIDDEVTGFENMLTTINDKFSTGHGAKVADRIADNVKTGMNEIKEITKGMDKAATRAAEKGTENAKLTKEDEDPKGTEAVDAVRGGVSTDGTLETGKVTHDADTRP